MAKITQRIFISNLQAKECQGRKPFSTEPYFISKDDDCQQRGNSVDTLSRLLDCWQRRCLQFSSDNGRILGASVQTRGHEPEIVSHSSIDFPAAAAVESKFWANHSR